ncbi:MAG TPA: type II secretion system protein GspL [Allosphingosinicella sp.]|nr:type II secretion system protein GspL [Allosphingosinicella sp.]
MSDFLLVFLSRAEGVDGWLRLVGEAVVARGQGTDGIDAQRGAPVVAVAPGEEVSLRWLELPGGLARAQAAAAAGLMAADFLAQPIDQLHVAVGDEDGPDRCAAFVPQERMERWLAALAGADIEADRLIPESLLLPPPDEGFACCDTGLIRLYRGPNEAFAAESELGALLLGGRSCAELDGAAFEAGLGAALAVADVDLLQGRFGRGRRLRVDAGRARRLVLLVAALLLLSLAVQVAAIARYSFAADAAEEEIRRIAAQALPRSAGVSDPARALAARLAELRGGGSGFTATSASLFQAVKGTPGVELSALSFGPEGVLRATATADNPAALDALRQRLEASGFSVSSAAPRTAGGRRVSELVVQPR